jgi:hypothetical protein
MGLLVHFRMVGNVFECFFSPFFPSLQFRFGGQNFSTSYIIFNAEDERLMVQFLGSYPVHTRYNIVTVLGFALSSLINKTVRYKYERLFS